MRRAAVPQLVCVALLVAPATANAELFEVTAGGDGSDDTPGDGLCATAGPDPVCTLRAAVEEAGALAGADEVAVRPDVSLSEGELLVSDPDPLAIRGAGSEIRQDGAGDARVLNVAAGSDVELSDLSLSGGGISATGAADGGAGIRNEGMLLLRRVDVHGNVLSAGLACFGCAAGAGIHNTAGAELTAEDSEIHGNHAESLAAGGAFSAGELRLERTTVAGNEAQDDAGLLVRSAVADLVNVTIAGNTAAGTCGAARIDSPVVAAGMALDHSTVAGNAAPGGAPGLCASGPGAGLRLSGSALDGGCTATMGAPAADSDGHNAESGTGCGLAAPGDRSGTPLLLGPLGENGGPVRTMAPEPGSPLLEAGGACPAADARGIARPQGVACDTGAVEATRSSDLTLTGSDTRDPVAAGASAAHSFTVANEGPHAAGGVSATFELPPAAELVAVPAGCTGAADRLACPVGVLTPGASRGIQLELRRAGPGTIQTRGTVVSNPTDPDPTDNAAQVTTTVAAVRAVVRVKRRQRLFRRRGIVLDASSALAGTATASARVAIGGRRHRFRGVRAAIAAGRSKRIRLRAPRRLLRAARRALRSGERLSARVTVRFAAQGLRAPAKRYRVRLLR